MLLEQDEYEFHSYTGEEAAATPSLVNAVSHVFSNSFGTNPQGRPYRLGPKKTRERLESTDHLFIAYHQTEGVAGYLYARILHATQGVLGWIDSLAVLPDHRRKKVATRLVNHLVDTISTCRWVGCATPNPIAALVITNVVHGKVYIDRCNPPGDVLNMIKEIRPKCPDLRGADFNASTLRVKTSFTPVSSEETKEWSPPHPSEPPPWWASLQNLPSEYEALLIIDRDQQ